MSRTASDGQQRIELPPSVLRCIRAVGTSTDLRTAEKLTAALLVIYGWAWYERQDKVDPTALSLPEGQWSQVVDLLSSDDPMQRTNVALDFMNLGPSSHKPDGG